jgi:hypothetical protein
MGRADPMHGVAKALSTQDYTKLLSAALYFGVRVIVISGGR